jgi:hypothetical protein
VRGKPPKASKAEMPDVDHAKEVAQAAYKRHRLRLSKPVVPVMIDRVKWTHALSEFEIQAKLYHELTKMGYCVRGEVAKNKCRFDLVVFDRPQGKALRIIEIKAGRMGEQKREREHQVSRYRRFGVGVDLICGEGEAELYLAACAGGVLPMPMFEPFL